LEVFISLVILAVIVGGGILWCVINQKDIVLQPPDRQKPPLSKEFTLNLDQKAKIIYDDWGEFDLFINNIDPLLKIVNIYLTPCESQTENFESQNIELGKEVHCFTTEECAVRFKLINIEDTKAEFETWYSCAPPGSGEPFPPTEIIISKDETADWQIYKNDNLGFYFYYPLDWTIWSEQSDKVVIGKEGYVIMTVSKVNNIDLSLSDFQEFITQEKNNIQNLETESILVNGNEATKITFKILALQPMSGPAKETEVFVNKKNLTIYFQYDYQENNIYNSIIDQILSTFRFLD